MISFSQEKIFQIKLTFYLILWILFSITASIYSKEYLSKQKVPWTFCLFLSLIGTVFGFVNVLVFSSFKFLTCGGHTVKKFNGDDGTGFSLFSPIGYLCIMFSFTHVVGTVLTNISTVLSAPSFTQTIKLNLYLLFLQLSLC